MNFPNIKVGEIWNLLFTSSVAYIQVRQSIVTVNMMTGIKPKMKVPIVMTDDIIKSILKFWIKFFRIISIYSYWSYYTIEVLEQINIFYDMLCDYILQIQKCTNRWIILKKLVSMNIEVIRLTDKWP